MGFYLRKSVSVGPLRFNLSKSGVGVSAGVCRFSKPNEALPQTVEHVVS
jgi:hypothetical protein